jgi:hypothetical protein
MPPQQPDRLLDLVDNRLNFRAHGLDPGIRGPERNVRTAQRQGGDT